MMPKIVSALRISRTSRLESSSDLSPFAVYRAFPGADYYGDSVAIGFAPRRQSHALPCCTFERRLGALFVPWLGSSPITLTHGSSGCPEFRRPKGSAPSSNALPAGLLLVRLELEFKQCS